MDTRYRHALVLLRRDLRLDDNTALLDACAHSRQITPAFIFDPRQLAPHRWRSGPGLAFMLDSLGQLHAELAVHGSGIAFAHDEPQAGLAELIRRTGCDAVFANRDYTPFARTRDEQLAATCKELGIGLHLSDDALLHAPGSVLTGSGNPYQVFTPFFKASATRAVPVPHPFTAWSQLQPMDANAHAAGQLMLDAAGTNRGPVEGGRGEAMDILTRLLAFGGYEQQRDIPALDATTRLSAHLKFGTVSVREAWHAVAGLLDPEHPLLRQFHWRDFFSHIGWHFPHVFGTSFHRQFDRIHWSDDDTAFDTWCAGETGFPIVDAGMRQLAATGFMHNRVRMITASFLVKDLHIDWRRGEAWFARHLADYDPAVNNGNWQWVASTGCDAQPWFRIFNPWLQQQRFDPDARYIRRWLPALAGVSSAHIADWGKHGIAGKHPLPRIDHREQAARARAMYRAAAGDSRA